jgi:hypothetical protein
MDAMGALAGMGGECCAVRVSSMLFYVSALLSSVLWSGVGVCCVSYAVLCCLLCCAVCLAVCC